MKRTLTTADLEEITVHLDHCLEVFSRQEVLLTAAELQLKAMLTTVSRELKQRGNKPDGQLQDTAGVTHRSSPSWPIRPPTFIFERLAGLKTE